MFARVYAAVSFTTTAETMVLCIYQQTDSRNCRMWGAISFQTLMNPSKECWGFRRGLWVEGLSWARRWNGRIRKQPLRLVAETKTAPSLTGGSGCAASGRARARRRHPRLRVRRNTFRARVCALDCDALCAGSDLAHRSSNDVFDLIGCIQWIAFNTRGILSSCTILIFATKKNLLIAYFCLSFIQPPRPIHLVRLTSVIDSLITCTRCSSPAHLQHFDVHPHLCVLCGIMRRVAGTHSRRGLYFH